MGECRNCGSTRLRELGFAGTLAPFFLRRVLRAEVRTRRSPHPLKRAFQGATAALNKLTSRIYPAAVVVQMQSCLNCSFLQTKYPFADDAISRLYSDYRSDSYNRERIFYEPDYANYAVLVGPYTEGNLERIPALTAWIRRHLDLTGASMLDYGGADGKYLPAFDGSKFVYEISDIAPEAGVTRIS